MSKPITLTQWIDLTDERYVPLTYDGTVIYDRERKSQAFASPTPQGRRKYRALFRRMSLKARALGYRKTEP